MKSGRLLFWLLALFLLGYFVLKGMLFLDPDYGWHLTMGRLTLSHGIPLTDPFSYTMPSYPFVDHEWLSNVLIARGVSVIGYDGVGVIYAVLTLGALLLSLATVKKKSLGFSLIPFFLSGMTLYSFGGVRPQVVTWFCFALLLWIIRQEKHFLRYRFFLPLLFLAWVNLHGGFALGVVTLLFSCGYWYRQKKISLWSLSLLLGSCLLATVITPYGYRMWWEVWMQMSDGTLHFTIQEWLPAVFSLDLTMWLFAALSLILVIRTIRKFSFLDQALYVCLFLSGLSSIRQMPLWFLIALPMTAEAIAVFFAQVVMIKEGERRFFLMGKALLLMACLFCLPSLWSVAAGLGLVGGSSMYPDHAISYLHKYTPQGQIFSTYDWGGYLIWKLPQKKVFIDGRMPSWRWHANLKGESNYAFLDYRNFVDNKVPFKSVIKKYTITTLLLPLPSDLRKDALTNKIMTFGANVLHLPLRKEEGFTHIVKEAKKAGWVVVYKDETAVIYQNKREEK